MKNLIAFAFSAFLLSCAGAPKTEVKSFIDENIDFARAQIGNEIGVIEASGKCLNPVTLKTDSSVSALYYAYAMESRNQFVSSWFGFNLTLNNILVALTARKFKLDIAPLIVGDTEVCEALRTSNARDFGLGTEVDYLEQLVKISETEELVDREKKLDQLRWDWMEEATFFDYFTVERLFVFLLQLEMIERWISLDKEKGNQLFRSIIAALKDEVQIPAEFR